MKLQIRPYLSQSNQWPIKGRNILAQFDEQTVVVYQAYSPVIGHWAATHNYFESGFSFNRMSWIKPNFLWMMYRSGWGIKNGQEVTLAIYLQRFAFDQILGQAVHSTYIPELYSNQDNWRKALAASDVRLQWDPDHDPEGNKLERRAIQLGLRGETLYRYAREWIIQIEDISGFVNEQREYSKNLSSYSTLQTPYESVYSVANIQTAEKLGIDLY